MSRVKIRDLIARGKIRIINLPAKIQEIKGNQVALLKDDIEDAKILL